MRHLTDMGILRHSYLFIYLFFTYKVYPRTLYSTLRTVPYSCVTCGESNRIRKGSWVDPLSPKILRSIDQAIEWNQSMMMLSLTSALERVANTGGYTFHLASPLHRQHSLSIKFSLVLVCKNQNQK